MFENRDRHPPAELDGRRIRGVVAGALAAAAVIALGLFLGGDRLSPARGGPDHTASIGTPAARANALTP